ARTIHRSGFVGLDGISSLDDVAIRGLIQKFFFGAVETIRSASRCLGPQSSSVIPRGCNFARFCPQVLRAARGCSRIFPKNATPRTVCPLNGAPVISGSLTPSSEWFVGDI